MGDKNPNKQKKKKKEVEKVQVLEPETTVVKNIVKRRS